MLRKIRLFVLPGLLSLGFLMTFSNPLFADSKVFVQNNTAYTFDVNSVQSGYSLSSSKWNQSASSVKPGERKEVIVFNRDSGIKSGKTFYFDTSLTIGSESLVLKQKLKGQWIGSHMWQSLSGYGISHPWYDDRNTHSATWYINGKSINVKYRAFYTGGYDHIEYILQEEHLVLPGDNGTFNVLAYNVYMRPEGLFANGQAIRAGLIPGRVQGYDAIVFSEAFDNSAREKLLNGLQSEYPYKTTIVGTDSGIRQDGGVIIVSKWPIEAEDQRTFGDDCSGDDCLSDKGVGYARINKQGKIFHLFGTHTQAWPTAAGQATRKIQFQIIKNFINSKNISETEPVLIAGDLNVDKVNYPAEYQQMLSILQATHPTQTGYAYSFDSDTNRLASDGPKEYLDYVLYSYVHQHPNASYNEVRMIRSLEEWKEFFWEYAYWDLSDHYAIYGRLEFSTSSSLNTAADLFPFFSINSF